MRELIYVYMCVYVCMYMIGPAPNSDILVFLNKKEINF